MALKLPVFSSKDFIRVARRLGFEIKKGGKGSHTRLVHSILHINLTIPKAEIISVGIRHQLLKDLEKIGVSQEKFISLLSISIFVIIKNFLKNIF
jgi:predicted RNA binding protein YcfA (HicA-like mRNA interferase family)